MPEKSVPLSVRISVDDAEFLARLKLEGATTPSEKMRKLLGEARRRRQATSDYGSAISIVRESLAPSVDSLRAVEHAENLHSEFVRIVADWLPETIAFLVSSVPRSGDEDRARALRGIEDGLADRVFRLLDQTLRLGVTPECPAYCPTLVADRLDHVLSLLDVIREARSR